MKFLVIDEATRKFLSKDWQPDQPHTYASNLAGAKVFDNYADAFDVRSGSERVQLIAGDTELLSPDAG